MAQDSYVQVAPDSSGKRIAMDQAVNADGSIVQLQKALLVGTPADALDQILQTDIQILAVLRAILATLAATSNSPVTEEDFTNIS